MGNQTLALTEALATGSPKASGGDRIFMDLAGRTLITLPIAAGVILLIGLLVGFAALAWMRRGLLRSLAAVLGTLVGSTALTWLALTLIGAVRRGMFWR